MLTDKMIKIAGATAIAGIAAVATAIGVIHRVRDDTYTKTVEVDGVTLWKKGIIEIHVSDIVDRQYDFEPETFSIIVNANTKIIINNKEATSEDIEVGQVLKIKMYDDVCSGDTIATYIKEMV